MKKILALSIILLAVNSAYASGDDSDVQISNSTVDIKPETKIIKNHDSSSKWYGGAAKALCKSWKEGGFSWQVWPLYKMAKSSCGISS
jgi:hypothetical protein